MSDQEQKPQNDRPHYTNFAKIKHTQTEFSVDFAVLYPPVNDSHKVPDGQVYGQVVTRLLMAPGHAKQLAQAFTDAVEKYEEQYGTIGAAVLPDKNILLN